MHACRNWLKAAALLLFATSGLAAPPENVDAARAARDSAAVVGHSLGKVHRWLHTVALPQIDPETGLYRADGHWNYRDTAADCYPFFVWAAHVVDREVLEGPARQVLRQEIALCSADDGIPVPWDFTTGAPVADIDWDERVFQASEYVKDGLIAIVEVTGRDAWFDRMRDIVDALWETARVDTPHGRIPSTNIEVNGELLQALARLYSMTREEKYLDWAERIADHYLSDEAFVVTRLRDHGCEIIGGLGLLHAVSTTHRPERARAYAPRLQRLYDTVLARGCNADGFMFDTLDKRAGRLSDGWGYNYVGLLCHDLATGADRYRPRIASVLRHLAKPAYQDYPWEGESIDGYADAIEGAIYLLNRVPVPEGRAWVDRETAANLVNHPTRLEHGALWGTMKLQSNAVRTVLMHAMLHTQGVIAQPWRPGLELGAIPLEDGGLLLALRAAEDYRGTLIFDIPRHRAHMGFAQDWPRMNTLPEWFTVSPDAPYHVRLGTADPVALSGARLHTGLEVAVEAGAWLEVRVKPLQ